MSVTPVNRRDLETIFDRQVLKGTRYGLGSKAKSLGQSPESITRIDCSGEVRYLIYKATGGRWTIPDGSWNQRDYFEKLAKQGVVRKVNYRDLPMADPSRVFIAFITPGVNGAGKIGHVWFVTKLDKDSVPDTMESYGGHGVGSRRWNHPTLMRQCSACFELPTV